MTSDVSLSAASTTSRTGSLRGGGVLLLSAGVLQLAAATTFVAPAVAEVLPPIVQLAAWGLGGVLLLAAELALALRGRLASTRPAALGRAAVLVFGATGLLDLLVVLTALTAVGGQGVTVAVIVIEHAVVLAASATTTTRTIRTTTLSPFSRYALVPVVLIDALALVLAATSATGELFLLSTYVLRPALLAAAGARYALIDKEPQTPPAHRWMREDTYPPTSIARSFSGLRLTQADVSTACLWDLSGRPPTHCTTLASSVRVCENGPCGSS